MEIYLGIYQLTLITSWTGKVVCVEFGDTHRFPITTGKIIEVQQ